MSSAAPGYLVVTLPADWASAIINGSVDDLAFEDPGEADRCTEWLAANDDLRILDVGEPYTGHYLGLITYVANFTAEVVH